MYQGDARHDAGFNSYGHSGSHSGSFRGQPNHRGGGRGGGRFNQRSPAGNRNGPYDRPGETRNQNYRNTGPKPHHGHHNGPSDIGRYVKHSFFENPWHKLEIRVGIPAYNANIQVSSVPAPTLPEIAPPPADPIEDAFATSSTSKLGLSLPPPKQQSSNTSSKISNFLSMLPPPKSSTSGDTMEDI